jgi:hypothetical protein
VRREEINPTPKRPMEKPSEIKRKNDPDWLWLKPRSVSRSGIKGPNMILDIKLQ